MFATVDQYHCYSTITGPKQETNTLRASLWFSVRNFHIWRSFQVILVSLSSWWPDRTGILYRSLRSLWSSVDTLFLTRSLICGSVCVLYYFIVTS